jgi:hypothetical protein
VALPPHLGPPMYQSPFLGLDEAARLFARVLRKTHPNSYPDDASALEEGRRELVQALFDGTVRSEGVRSELPEPEPPGQFGPFPDPSPSAWVPIERGWWSNLRYEKLTCAKPDKTEDFGIDWERLFVPLEAASDPSIIERESSSSLEDKPSLDKFAKYQLDKCVVNWVDDSFEIDENYISDWFYHRIKILRTDILSILSQETSFDQSITTPSDSQQRPQPLQDAGASVSDANSTPPALEGRRRGRPPDLRNNALDWLDKHGPALLHKANAEIAHIYCREELHFHDENRLQKAVDIYRKHVRTWRLRHNQQG